MFKDDVELIDSVLSKLDKERHHVMGVPIYRWFNYEINKYGEVLLHITYKIEPIEEPIFRNIMIDRYHFSVSYIKLVINKNLEEFVDMILCRIMESEW